MKQLPAEQPSREKEELKPVEQVTGEISLLNMQLLGDEQSGLLVVHKDSLGRMRADCQTLWFCKEFGFFCLLTHCCCMLFG